jgi:hypothetical protein
MEHEEEKEKGFKVEDRRRFSSEGELKPEYQRDEPAAPAAPQTSTSSSSANATAEPRAAAPGVSSTPPAADSEITFPAFLVGISTQALVHLGEIPDPNGEQAAINLPAAQQLIDIVGMLKEKTRGNLDREEAELIEGILFELRMKYVERSRKP